METLHIVHSFEPVFDENSRVLILGSLPSVKSRENGFYYGHPQNRFWRVTAAVFGESVPLTVEEKRAMLLRNGAAIWDVVSECDIMGSSDASIRNVIPTDIAALLKKTAVRAVFTNGGTADRIYRRYQLPLTGVEAVKLPSTSPANAAWQLDRLTEAWRVIAG
ncbi:MAG: DNA-deoxyinosine glycosylase [Ruminiclostridium sp.]|nr:DNA-deoxyinosine glycosylase [Ruminiclostridium sp.]